MGLVVPKTGRASETTGGVGTVAGSGVPYLLVAAVVVGPVASGVVARAAPLLEAVGDDVVISVVRLPLRRTQVLIGPATSLASSQTCTEKPEPVVPLVVVVQTLRRLLGAAPIGASQIALTAEGDPRRGPRVIA